MKNILLLTLVFIGCNLFGQEDFKIVPEKENPICIGDSLFLEIKPDVDLDKYEIAWAPIPGKLPRISIKPEKATTYTATLTDQTTAKEIKITYEVVLATPVNIDIESIQKSCVYNNPFDERISKESDQYHAAELKIKNNSGEKYKYTWFYKAGDKYKNINDLDDGRLHLDGPNNSELAERVYALEANTKMAVIVNNEKGQCAIVTKKTERQKVADVTINVDPKDKVYLQNPVAHFSFEDNDSDNPTSAWIWKFNGTDSQPLKNDTTTVKDPFYTFQFDGTHNVQLLTINSYKCDTTYPITYEVKPVKLSVPNYIVQGKAWKISLDEGNNNNPNNNPNPTPKFKAGTPDNQQTNQADNEYLPLNDYYKSCDVLVFSRSGRKIYKSTDYKNDWTADNVKAGVYYYILRCKGYFRDDTYKGSVTVFVK
ncbi:MAG: gliding motility-associated C-terminal domain-containing protein [Bacteroidales bacterium]